MSDLFKDKYSIPLLLRIHDDPYRGPIFFESTVRRPYPAQAAYRKMLSKTMQAHRTLRSNYIGIEEMAARRSLVEKQLFVLRNWAYHAYTENNIGFFMVMYLVDVARTMGDDYVPASFRLPRYSSDASCYNRWNNRLSDCHDADDCECELRESLDIATCDDCGECFSNDDMNSVCGQYICEGCTNDNYTWSDYEDQWIPNDDAVDAIDEYGNRVTIHCNNEYFNYSESEECYVHEDYDPPSRTPTEHNIIRDYHSSRGNFVAKNDAWVNRYNYHMGVELEVEVNDGESRGEAALRIHEAVNTSGEIGERMFFERDGSLQNGFEMITQPMSIPALAETFKFLENPDLTKGIRSHMTKTCGLHVHVSKRGLTNLQINKIVAFVNDPKHEWLIRAVARRYSTGFCQIKSKKLGSLHYRQDDRYEAVNLQGSRTIEFRIFRGSLKYRSVMAALEFCHALIQFCRPAEAGIHDLTAEKFLIFCRNKMRKETMHLIGFLDSRLPNHRQAA